MTSQKKILIGISAFTAILFLIIMFMFNKVSETSSQQPEKSNVYIENGIQIIEIKARGGYSPNLTNAKADQETILRISTKNTFDCSSAFFIPQLNITKNLPQNGVTEIPIGKIAAGTNLIGTCSMGMYSLTINFN